MKCSMQGRENAGSNAIDECRPLTRSDSTASEAPMLKRRQARTETDKSRLKDRKHNYSVNKVGPAHLSARTISFPFPLFPIFTECSDSISALKKRARTAETDKEFIFITCNDRRSENIFERRCSFVSEDQGEVT